jgi:hypothetical protein
MPVDDHGLVDVDRPDGGIVDGFQSPRDRD